MGLRQMHSARNRGSQTPRIAPDTVATPPADGSYGFAEELGGALALEKLVGRNFLDDGRLLEADDKDPAAAVRKSLATMDAKALAIRADLNALVREGVGMVEAAQTVDLGDGAGVVARMRPVLGRVMTAYTELVAGLQAARESIGYDVEGPSVTSVGDQEEVHERVTKRFARRDPRPFVRESAPAGGAKLFAVLAGAQKDPSKRDEGATNAAHALQSIGDALVDVAHGHKEPGAVKATLAAGVLTLRSAFKTLPDDLDMAAVLKAVALGTGAEDDLRKHAARLKKMGVELKTASVAAIRNSNQPGT